MLTFYCGNEDTINFHTWSAINPIYRLKLKTDKKDNLNLDVTKMRLLQTYLVSAVYFSSSCDKWPLNGSIGLIYKKKNNIWTSVFCFFVKE